jgi:hypothetical protein
MLLIQKNMSPPTPGFLFQLNRERERERERQREGGREGKETESIYKSYPTNMTHVYSKFIPI